MLRPSTSNGKISHIVCAEGYRVVHDADGKLLHCLNPAYASDGRAVDPTRIESLLYVVLPGGSKLLVGGMFIMPNGQRGPAVGGSLTQWHAHDDLCLDPVKAIAITQLPGGGCPAGSAVGATGEMMHVWAVECPAGPFGELDAGMLREAALDVYGIGVQPVSGRRRHGRRRPGRRRRLRGDVAAGCALHFRRCVQPVGNAAGLSAAAPSVQAWSRSRP